MLPEVITLKKTAIKHRLLKYSEVFKIQIEKRFKIQRVPWSHKKILAKLLQ